MGVLREWAREAPYSISSAKRKWYGAIIGGGLFNLMWRGRAGGSPILMVAAQVVAGAALVARNS